jgi:hypothetical protein
MRAPGQKLRETEGCETPASLATSVQEADPGMFGRRPLVLSLTPTLGYDQLVVYRESIGSGGAMVGESLKVSVLRAHDGYPWA